MIYLLLYVHIMLDKPHSWRITATAGPVIHFRESNFQSAATTVMHHARTMRKVSILSVSLLCSLSRQSGFFKITKKSEEVRK